MDIYNVEEHLSCFCYESGVKPLIEVLNFKSMASDEISLISHEIVFVLKGKIRYTMNNLPTEVAKGQFVLLPANSSIHCKALSKCVVLVLRLDENIQICNTFNMNRLNSKIKSVNKPGGLSTLDINVRLKSFVDALLETCTDGLKCRYYFVARITELLIMLRVYYSEEQLYLFFYYYLTSDIRFAEFVRTNHMQYATVNKFASAMKMTPQQFSRRFCNVFGEAPYGWMQREKARLVYGEICRSDRPLKEIAYEYGFSIQANFNRFCKMAFGMNPGEIRKKRVDMELKI